VSGARALAAGALAALLAGCGALRGVEPGEAPPVEEARPPAGDTERLLQYFGRLRRLPGAELAREHDAARADYGRARSDFNRVRYAMLLALPGAAFADEARALEVLEPVAKNAAAPLHGLAYLLAAFVQEQRRLAGSVQSLRDSVQGLQQKLDALRSLERSLIERGESGGRKR
jgi:hypothetical protein